MGLFGRRRQDAAVAGSRVEVVPLLFGVDGTHLVDVDLPPESRPLSRAVVEGHIVVAYAFDRPETYEVVQVSRALELGGDEAVHRAAIETLRRRAERELVVEGGDGRFRVKLDGSSRDLTASLVLAPDLFLSRIPLSGPAVIGIGNRIWIHLVDGGGAEELRGLREFNAALYASGEAKPISPDLFQIDRDGSLERLEVTG